MYYHTREEIDTIAAVTDLYTAEELHRKAWDAKDAANIEKWSRVVAALRAEGVTP